MWLEAVAVGLDLSVLMLGRCARYVSASCAHAPQLRCAGF